MVKEKKFVAALWLTAALLYSPALIAQTQNPPPPWQSADVGDVGTAGSTSLGTDGALVVAGAGSDIWGSADSFRFVYQPVRDTFVSAHIVSMTNTNPLAKTGVMIRQSPDPGSPFIILDVKPDGGLELMIRSTFGGETTFLAGGSVPVTPGPDDSVAMDIDLSLLRRGDVVTAAYGVRTPGGGSFGSSIGPPRNSFPAGLALAGAAVTSHDPSRLNRAVFGSLPSVQAIPSPPWKATDVGDVGVHGFATHEVDTDTFFVTGAGSDIWDTADSFFAVTQFLNGDLSLTARVVDMEHTHPYAKAGIEVGEPSPSAARVLLDVKPDGGIEFMARTAAGQPMAFVAGASASFPVWLRISRAGDDFQGQFSSDGQTWTTVGSVTVSLPPTIQAGLVVTSHDPAVTNTARFDHVSTTQPPKPTGNLLVNPGFEESTVPDLGPGWVSDADRQTPAQTSTASPHGGSQHAACETTEALDCGIYQDFILPATGTYVFTVYVASDKPGVLVGVNVNGKGTARSASVGEYAPISVGLQGLRTGDRIRVWIYSPAAPGRVVVDDASFVLYTGPT